MQIKAFLLKEQNYSQSTIDKEYRLLNRTFKEAIKKAYVYIVVATEKENDFSEIFSPKRFDLSLSVNNIANDIIKTAKNFIVQKIEIPESKIEHIKKGHAGIVEYNGEQVGVYKDCSGKVFIVSTKCSHLGCQLHWNADELTWDCPCHGSRFSYKGEIIEGPAHDSLTCHHNKIDPNVIK